MKRLIYTASQNPDAMSALAQVMASAGYDSRQYTSGRDLLDANDARRPDLVVLDFAFPDLDGLELLRAVRLSAPDVPIAMIADNVTAATVMTMVDFHIAAYFQPPYESQVLLLAIRGAIETTDEPRPSRRTNEQSDEWDEMVGKSAAMGLLREKIGCVAPGPATVLITGETGVGKELVAHELHKQSQRESRAFVPVNCASFPETLIEDELYGHEKGALTNANVQRKGRFQEAEGGTLFLDEIAQLSLPAQAKLLRAVERKEIQRVGSDRITRVDVRLVTATNRSLREQVEQKLFLNDLYQRLDVVIIDVPPLRERMEDIEPLARYFIARLTRTYHRDLRFTPESWVILKAHGWPGNVRELQHVIERAFNEKGTDQIEACKLRSLLHAEVRVPADRSFKAGMLRAQGVLVNGALAENDGNVAKAATSLGMGTYSLRRVMDRCGIAAPTKNPGGD
jgi:DNA-binding NtrC family response regulator